MARKHARAKRLGVGGARERLALQMSGWFRGGRHAARVTRCLLLRPAASCRAAAMRACGWRWLEAACGGSTGVVVVVCVVCRVVVRF